MSPNQITTLALLIALIAVYLVIQEKFIAAFVVWWLSRLLDALDGIYARTYKRT